MHKLSFFASILPALTLVLSSCNNTKSVNYISIGDAIAFAQENFDEHIHDGYNVTYLIDTKDSKMDDIRVYKKHYYDPNETSGEYFLEKFYEADLNLQNIIATLYYTQTLSFGSTDLLAFHEAIAAIRADIGYIDCGFTMIDNHLGYYISSEHLQAIAQILSELLEIAAYVFIDSKIVEVITYLLRSFTADVGTCIADIRFTRFGFLDKVNLTFKVNNAWFDVSNFTTLIDTFYGDYISINEGNINFSLVCNYTL